MTFTERRKWRLSLPFGVFALLMLASLACFGESVDVEGFSLRKTYELKGGERRSGDQLIMADEIKLEAESSIDGAVTLIGSRVELNAEIEGDVVVIADRLELGDAAHINGDLAACVTDLERSEYARIDGDLNRECDEGGPATFKSIFESGVSGWRENFLVRLSSAIAGALFFGALAGLSTVIFPQPLIRMSDSIRQTPATTGGVGCLTVLVAIGLTVVYVVSLLLILPVILLPVVIGGWLLLGLASLLGWVALAEPFGKSLFRILGMDEQPRMIAAVIGGITLTLLIRVWSVFWFTAWIGLLATAILGSVGLGAVVLTRAGTRPFPRPEPGPSVQSAVE